MQKSGTLIGGTLLVAGTSIGGGMLALPVLTALGGFIPAVIIYLFCWLFMACTGLLLMEACLWMGKESNIITMARYTLGKKGKVTAWILYLFLFYCLTIAYISGGGHLVADAITQIFVPLSSLWGSVLFVLIFAPFVYLGARSVDRINFVLMFGLIGSFILFIILSASSVDKNNLTNINWPFAILATPVVFTSFAFQGIIPTLTHYMGQNPWRTRTVIWWGSSIPFVTYVIWEWLILGIVPLDGKSGLIETLHMGETAIYPLKEMIKHPWIYTIGQFFAFFAIVTSFLGVTLGLLDFLADGLGISKTSKTKLWLTFLVFIPPLLISLTNPRLFLIALDFAGGFGCALLLGLLPILMVWSGRYRLKLASGYSLPGGKVVLSLLILFVMSELLVMFYKLTFAEDLL